LKGEAEGKRQLEKPRRRYEDNIKKQVCKKLAWRSWKLLISLRLGKNGGVL
jgi:hypothetical protein